MSTLYKTNILLVLVGDLVINKYLLSIYYAIGSANTCLNGVFNVYTKMLLILVCLTSLLTSIFELEAKYILGK